MAITENVSNFINNMAAVQGAKRTISCSDNSISQLHEALTVRESLWNSKIPIYRDKNVRKRDQYFLVAILRDGMPDIDF